MILIRSVTGAKSKTIMFILKQEKNSDKTLKQLTALRDS